MDFQRQKETMFSPGLHTALKTSWFEPLGRPLGEPLQFGNTISYSMRHTRL
jgi:hypothetical protein